MSDTNVIPLFVKPNINDAKHARLRQFFDVVADTADEVGVIAYSIAALHAPDPDAEGGCIHADVAGLADSIDAEWVDATLEGMGQATAAVWTVVKRHVEQNAADHAASDAAKPEKDDE
jgi:hypothetical protein